MEEPLLTHTTNNAGRNGAITPTTTTSPARFGNSSGEPTSSSNLTAFCRVSAVIAVTVISLWANYEASKGFEITVLEAPGTTFAARHYNLMFVSNGGAARAILNASASIERALYPDSGTEHFPRKAIKSVTLRVAGHNLTQTVIVTGYTTAGVGGECYVIHLSPNIIEENDAHDSVVAAVYRGMARVWVRDGRGASPAAVVDAVVGFLCGSAGFEGKVGGVNATAVQRREAAVGCEIAVGFVGYCEERRPGFVARLNRAMEEIWEDGMLDIALGSSARVMCAGFRSGLNWVRDPARNSTGKTAELA